jgi:hypothetical protein
MDNRSDVREFLTSRRARLSPADAGLPDYGTRRVPGLRRSEAAMLAGVSVEYYTRMERGNLGGVSESVLDSLARGLRLDEAERAHLFDLARAAGPAARAPRRKGASGVRPSIGRVLDALAGGPAYVRNARTDILAVNDLCRALYGDILAPQVLPLNLARFMFLDERARDFFTDWDDVAGDVVATLRGQAGRDPLDRALTDLVGELATRSADFRSRWASHDVRLHRTSVKRLRNPVVGDIELTGDAFELPGDGLTLIVYTAERGSSAQQQLDFLASWSSGSASRNPQATQ